MLLCQSSSAIFCAKCFNCKVKIAKWRYCCDTFVQCSCVFRANGLESACKDKDATIDTLRREIEELKTITLETPRGALPTEGEDVAKVSTTENAVISVTSSRVLIVMQASPLILLLQT